MNARITTKHHAGGNCDRPECRSANASVRSAASFHREFAFRLNAEGPSLATYKPVSPLNANWSATLSQDVITTATIPVDSTSPAPVAVFTNPSSGGIAGNTQVEALAMVNGGAGRPICHIARDQTADGGWRATPLVGGRAAEQVAGGVAYSGTAQSAVYGLFAEVGQLYSTSLGSDGLTWSAPAGMWLPRTTTASLQVDYELQGKPAIDPITDKVSFPTTSQKVSVTPTDVPSWWDRLWGNFSVPDAVAGVIQSQLQTAFKAFALPDVNAFALTSLLFPSEHKIHLKNAALPTDLYLTGSLDRPITVTPAATALAPGASVQLSAAGLPAASILWEIKPRLGSISATGLYTAPSTLSSAEVVVVTAVNKSDLSSVGSAMALVSQTPAVHGVAVAPRSSLVTPGQSVQLSTSDATGSPVSVNWTLSPNIGQFTAGWSEGQYTYTAPATIAGATVVTALAVNAANRGQTGAADIQVAPSTTVSVQPTQSDAKRGAIVALTATVTAGDIGNLRWVVYPLGAGTIAPDPADPSKVTFTAPASNAKAGQARVVAYLLDDQTVGLGSADIALKV